MYGFAPTDEQKMLIDAVARYAKEQGVMPAAVESYQSIQGKGAEGVFAGEQFWVGSLRLMAEKARVHSVYSKYSGGGGKSRSIDA